MSRGSGEGGLGGRNSCGHILAGRREGEVVEVHLVVPIGLNS